MLLNWQFSTLTESVISTSIPNYVYMSRRSIFCPCGVPQKWGIFLNSLNYQTYRTIFVVFNKRNSFLMLPKDLNAVLTFVHAAEMVI